jgi:uncharacterized protein (TIGR00304 family)
MPMLNRFTAAAACLFIIGLVLVAVSLLRGEGSAGIAMCIPFFYGTGPLASLGVLCFFIGAVLLFFGIARSAAEAAGPELGREPAGPEGSTGPAPSNAAQATPRARAGGVILIGPVPVVFGSDPGISRAMFYLALGLMAALLVMLLALALL